VFVRDLAFRDILFSVFFLTHASNTLTLTHTHTLAHSHSQSRSQSLTHSYTYEHSLTLTQGGGPRLNGIEPERPIAYLFLLRGGCIRILTAGRRERRTFVKELGTAGFDFG